MSNIDPIIRDKRTKEAFIEYLVAHPDERFYQALTNFANVDFIGSASTPEGGDFEDLWNVEADERMVSYE